VSDRVASRASLHSHEQSVHRTGGWGSPTFARRYSLETWTRECLRISLKSASWKERGDHIFAPPAHGRMCQSQKHNPGKGKDKSNTLVPGKHIDLSIIRFDSLMRNFGFRPRSSLPSFNWWEPFGITVLVVAVPNGCPFYPVNDLIAAFNEHTQSCFRPGWINCLDESMSLWTNMWTCPGWMYVPRKPHPIGNEYHTLCCGLSGIMYAI
jgi:hypothetical protein